VYVHEGENVCVCVCVCVCEGREKELVLDWITFTEFC
jgi:hypothetical protein